MFQKSAQTSDVNKLLKTEIFEEIKMPYLREVREALFLAHLNNIIDDDEFVCLYDLNRSKNLDYPYWNYQKFDLEELTDDECWSEFRFFKRDIYKLQEVLNIPDEILTYNRLKVDGIEALCVFLKRFAYPCRYSDMVPRFGRPVPQFSIISNYVMSSVYQDFHHLLADLNQPVFAPANLERFCQVIHDKGAALDNCWGFIDGTVRPICRPGENQRVLYNGHKKVHALKFQSVVAPNGLIANLYGPVEGKKHDSGMLADSNLLQQLQQRSYDTNGRVLCIYGDPAYPLRLHLQAPFRNPVLTQPQKDFNKSMSQVRISVEWIFGDIIKWFAFMDFKKNLKVALTAVGKMYIVCALLANARTCMYGNTTATFFQLPPPNIEDYFQ